MVRQQSSETRDIDRMIGQRLRHRRLMLGLSMQEVAPMIGVTFQQLQKYESGANRISASRLYQFMTSLSVHPDFFFSDQDLHRPHEELSDPLIQRWFAAYQQLPNRTIAERIVSMTEQISGGSASAEGS